MSGLMTAVCAAVAFALGLALGVAIGRCVERYTLLGPDSPTPDDDDPAATAADATARYHAL